MKIKKPPSSYDIVGSKEKAVAIIEIPDELKQKEKDIAEEILRKHKNIKSVLKKLSERKDIYRIRLHELLSGDPNTEVVHIEHGYKLKLDPQKVYFSGREGTERSRIAQLVKPKETVMLMFAGVCPFGIAIAKKQPSVKIVAIEINPIAYEYMKENMRINKLNDKIIPVLGDVKKKSKNWYGKCDRVIMPLPHKAIEYLDSAFNCLKPKGGTIHVYLLEKEENIDKVAKRIVTDFKKKIKKKINYSINKTLPYAPGKNKYCIDMKLF